MQNHTLRDLSQTKIGQASRAIVVIVAWADGLAPFLSALVVLVPFFFAPRLLDVATSCYPLLAMALAILFGFGAFLGIVSRHSLILLGASTITAGWVFISVKLSLLSMASGGVTRL